MRWINSKSNVFVCPALHTLYLSSCPGLLLRRQRCIIPHTCRKAGWRHLAVTISPCRGDRTLGKGFAVNFLFLNTFEIFFRKTSLRRSWGKIQNIFFGKDIEICKIKVYLRVECDKFLQFFIFQREHFRRSSKERTIRSNSFSFTVVVEEVIPKRFFTCVHVSVDIVLRMDRMTLFFSLTDTEITPDNVLDNHNKCIWGVEQFKSVEKNFYISKSGIFFIFSTSSGGWFLISKFKKHQRITFWIPKFKVRVQWVNWFLFWVDMI